MIARLWGFKSPLPHIYASLFSVSRLTMNANNTAKIHLLDESVIQKIAAGEVIERPASVAKELVENAIDAGASFIDIIIEDAGFSSIQVVDNGLGMGPDDIQKCLLRHATSKISSAEDLFSISSMGFRGEALASIAAVSRMSVASSNTDDGLGNTIASEGGAVSEIAPAQHTRGTTITCRDLFFNVPARKKFMKSRKAERMALLKLLEQLVLSFPSIHFTCTTEGKRSFDLPQVDTPHMRIAQLAGTDFAKKLIYCSGEIPDMSVEIYLSDPQNATARPRYQNLYVNLRRVDNDSVLYAVREAFSRFITSHLKASWFCFLEIDPSRMDVNIHPTKQKIKFDDEKALFSFIFRTVHSSISQALNVDESLERKAVEPFPPPEESSIADTKVKGLHPAADGGRDISTGSANNDIKVAGKDVKKYISSDKILEGSRQTSLSFLSVFDGKEIIEKGIENGDTKSVELTDRPWNLIPCYQIHKMYILAPIKNGVVLIDQHAAHERILYEEALEDIKRGKGESQRLLFPVTFDMSVTEKEVVLASRDYFNALGFDVQDFGGHTLAVSAMPTTGFMKSSNVEEAVREVVHNLIEEKDKEILSAPQKRFAASFACGAAIKFGQELKQEEMNLLLNNLFATKNPYICPHGRPTLVRISLEELSRRFLR